ncbi:LamG-like jellyroll fold domain-containing protein [Flavobacterium sp.]|uniref:LamG-like jellyroll fold domain-containing protein n=1 Tax=Flavobacterium sp. TaxID=239 RepID=UPI0035B19708
MKKTVLILILLVQVSWSQTPIYEWNFNNSLYDTSNNFLLASSPNVIGSYTTDRFGNANAAYATPLNTNVELSVSGLTNLPQGSNARTLSIWIKPKTSNQSTFGVFEYGTQANNQVCGLTQQGAYGTIIQSLKAYGYANDFNSPNNSAIYNYATNDAEWYHYVLTYDIGMLRVYRNGNLLIEQNSATWNTQGTTLRLLSSIATNLVGGNYSFTFDDLKIYNTVLTQTQINQMYQNEFPASNTDLIAYFPFNNSYNATVGNYAFAPVNSGNLSYIAGVKGQGVNVGNGNALANGGGYGSDNLADDLSNQNLTVSFWMKRNANATNAYETASELFGSMYFRDRPSSISIGSRRETGVATGTSSATFFGNGYYFDENLLGKWMHVAQVFYTEGSLRYFAVYINGELKNTGLVSSNPLYKFNSVVALGGGTDSGGNFMTNKYANIAIDEVMYFNRSLSFPEILSLRFFEPTSLSKENFSIQNSNLYPNPTSSIFNVEIPNEVVKQVTIFDLSGKKLLKSNQHQIDVSSFATGIYMVQILTESGKTGVSKLVKK